MLLVLHGGLLVTYGSASTFIRETSITATPEQMQTPLHFNVLNPGTGGRLDLVVTALPVNNGSPITDIEYRLDGGAWVSVGSAALGTYAITGLTNDQAYFVEVRCRNAVGAQQNPPQGVTRTPTFTATVPAQMSPSSWTVEDTKQGGQVLLTLLAAPDDGGSALLSYEYQLNGGTWVSLGSTALGGYTIGGLIDNTDYTMAVRAVNAIGNGPASATKTVRPTSSTQGSYTPDATASTVSDAKTQLAAWAANWPGGTKRYLRLDAGSHGTTTFSGYSFAGEVVLYGQNQNGSAVFTGVTIQNCTGLAIEYMLIDGRAYITTCNGSGYRHCRLRGDPTETSPGGTGTGRGIDVRGGNGNFVEYCLVEWFIGNGVHVTSSNNFILRKNIFNHSGKDDFAHADTVGILVDRNWFSAEDENNPTAHLDGCQGQPLGGTGAGCRQGTYIGNVSHACDLNHVGSLPAAHGIFLSTLTVHDGTIRDNFLVTSNQHGITRNGPGPGGAPSDISNNTCISQPGSGLTGAQNLISQITPGSQVTGSNNVEHRNTPPFGTGSVAITAADLSTYFGALRTGSEPYALGAPGSDFSDWYPKTGTIMHWDHPTPKGAWSRLKEIFVQGIHPGNDGWPTAAAWNATHNKHGRITS